MAITADAIALTIAWWATQWDKITVMTADELTTEDATPVEEEETGYLQSTAYFAYNKANFAIAKAKTYAGVTELAENAISLVKTNRQTLTLVRKDFLEAE